MVAPFRDLEAEGITTVLGGFRAHSQAILAKICHLPKLNRKPPVSENIRGFSDR